MRSEETRQNRRTLSSEARSRKSHHELSKVAGYQGQLDMESLPNEEEVAFARMGSMINRLGGKKSTEVIAILNVTQDPKVMAKKLSAALSCRSHISGSLGPGGVKLVEEALARGGKSLADATEDEVNAVIESFDIQRSQKIRLVTRRSHISGSLGAGGGKLVEEALARGGKSLADATEDEVNDIINTLRSACPGRKAYKTMSAEEESQLNEKISLRHQESLKKYDECLGNKFIEESGEWKDRTTGPWSVEEIKIVMDAEGHWHSKNMYHILARRLEGRGAGQIGSWIRMHKKKRLA